MAHSKSSKHLFLQNYDAILGYRADDSYFAFAKMFLSKKIQRMNKAKEDFHKLIDNYSITEEASDDSINAQAKALCCNFYDVMEI